MSILPKAYHYGPLHTMHPILWSAHNDNYSFMHINPYQLLPGVLFPGMFEDSKILGG